jgi:septal ring factor EnvC (AmiA/AmiB activator)
MAIICKYCRSAFARPYNLTRHLAVCKELPNYENKLETNIKLLNTTIENNDHLITELNTEIKDLNKEIKNLKAEVITIKNHFYTTQKIKPGKQKVVVITSKKNKS